MRKLALATVAWNTLHIIFFKYTHLKLEIDVSERFFYHLPIYSLSNLSFLAVTLCMNFASKTHVTTFDPVLHVSIRYP